MRKIDDGRGEMEGGRDREREGMGWGEGGGAEMGGERRFGYLLIHVDNRVNVAMEIFLIE